MRLSLNLLLIPGLLGVFAGVQGLHRIFQIPIETIAMAVPLKCPLKLYLGLSCPTCGLGRAVLCILAGRLNDSVQYHILGIPTFIAICGLCFFHGSKAIAKLMTT